MTRAMQYRFFWYQLSALITAGLPLLRCFNVILFQTSDQDSFYIGIRQISQDIQGGCSFSEAMKKSGLFSKAEVNIVRAGEVGGMLEVMLAQLANGSVSGRADQYQSFYRVLASLMMSGVPILQSLKICSQDLDGPLLVAVNEIAESIKDGDTLSVPMDQSKAFSAFEVSLIDVGEETGCIAEMLLQLAGMCRPLEFKA